MTTGTHVFLQGPAKISLISSSGQKWWKPTPQSFLPAIWKSELNSFKELTCSCSKSWWRRQDRAPAFLAESHHLRTDSFSILKDSVVQRADMFWEVSSFGVWLLLVANEAVWPIYVPLSSWHFSARHGTRRGLQYLCWSQSLFQLCDVWPWLAKVAYVNSEEPTNIIATLF